jgi:heme-degrading monooxygenase HmoA
MLCLLSARRLKPGAYEQFREAWDPGDERPPGLQRVYHLRNVRDENEVVSFGLFDTTLDEFNRWREGTPGVEDSRQSDMSEYVESVIVEGIYEVAEVLEG